MNSFAEMAGGLFPCNCDESLLLALNIVIVCCLIIGAILAIPCTIARLFAKSEKAKRVLLILCIIGWVILAAAILFSDWPADIACPDLCP